MPSGAVLRRGSIPSERRGAPIARKVAPPTSSGRPQRSQSVSRPVTMQSAAEARPQKEYAATTTVARNDEDQIELAKMKAKVTNATASDKKIGVKIF